MVLVQLHAPDGTTEAVALNHETANPTHYRVRPDPKNGLVWLEIVGGRAIFGDADWAEQLAASLEGGAWIVREASERKGEE